MATIGPVVLAASPSTRTFRVDANAPHALTCTVSRYSAVVTQVKCRHGFWWCGEKTFLFFAGEQIAVYGWRFPPPSVLPDISPTRREIG
ncbi:hypothetical protein GGQ73_004357 [Rhizobium skierniewicense]|uniref:Uncharacterized protein n=1 Tax=Rhizobium skierniewicense TaxID=984260 RepID=A0A7W6CJS1_9HYPH|nr:hypothetical protein [Rhizobium skierniewicense]